MAAEILTLGEFLRTEREKRGYTIEQVASATKIGVRNLHALEGDHFAELPAKPFVRGFVISYCRFIGLEPKEVLANYSSFIQQKSKERPNRESGHSGYAFDKREGIQRSRTLLFIAVFGFILVGSLALLILKPTLHERRKSHIDKLRAAHSKKVDLKGKAEDVVPAIATSKEAQKPDDTKTALGEWISKSSSSGDEVDKLLPKNTLPSGTPVTEVSETTQVLESDRKKEGTVSQNQSDSLTQAAASSTPSTSTKEVENKKLSEKLPEKLEQQKKKESSASQSLPVSPSVKKAGSDPDDPLDSGRTIPQSEIKHRAVFKVKEDVWVRYRADNLPERKFIIRAGGTLVLKARDAIRFQVSNPDAVTYSYAGSSFRGMTQSGQMVMSQDEASLFFPHKLGTASGASFLDTSALPNRVPPKGNQASAD